MQLVILTATMQSFYGNFSQSFIPGTRTCLKIPRESRCCTNRSQTRREAQGIAVAIAKPINAGCGRMVRNPQGRGICSASLRRSSLIWNNQTSFLASCAASANAAVATVRNSETGSSYFRTVIQHVIWNVSKANSIRCRDNQLKPLHSRPLDTKISTWVRHPRPVASKDWR